MKLDVLLSDGDYQNTYAILRALKEKNLRVGIIFNYKPSLSFFSKYVDKKFFIKSDIVKHPEDNVLKAYAAELIRILNKNSINVFLPIGNISYRFASIYKKELKKYCEVPVVDYSLMQVAQDKNKTFEYAEKNNFPIPYTIRIKDGEDLNEIIKRAPLPCVIKKTNYDEGGVIYCNTEKKLKENLTLLQSKKKDKHSNPIIQEYVLGKGTGYYGIYDMGKCLAYFMHERNHEYPITGGASSLAKSINDKELKEIGNKILEGLKWHGVAMVEFKRDSKTNKLKLMEINPKFWGSLELSHKSGINFPYLAYLLAMKKSIPETTYQTNVYFRWTIPNDILWYRFASKHDRKEFKLLKNNVKLYSNIHWDDPLTVMYNSLITILKLFKDKKYPHGHIK